MYCKKCGEKIKEGNKFCTNCGEKISSPLKNNKSFKNYFFAKEKIEYTPFLRLLKILYFLAIILCFIFLGFYIKKTTGVIKTTAIDYEKSMIFCENGDSFSLQEKGIFSGAKNYNEHKGSGLYYAKLYGKENKEFENKIKELCFSFNNLNPGVKPNFSITPKNFKTDFKYKDVYNYKIISKLFIKVFLGIFIIFVIFELIKRLFFYVMTGRLKIK